MGINISGSNPIFSSPVVAKTPVIDAQTPGGNVSKAALPKPRDFVQKDTYDQTGLTQIISAPPPFITTYDTPTGQTGNSTDAPTVAERGSGNQGFGIGDILGGGNNIWGGMGDPGDNKIQPAPYDYQANGYIPPLNAGGYGLKKSGQGIPQELGAFTKAEQAKFDTWQNAVLRGRKPTDAANDLGPGAYLKPLLTVPGHPEQDQWQFRVSKGTRVSFTFDEKLHKCDIVGIGHT